MRTLLAILLLIVGLLPCTSLADNLIRVKQLDHGILASGDGLAGKHVQIVERTERIPGRTGLAFGLTFEFEGGSPGDYLSYQTEISFRPARGTENGAPRIRFTKTRRTRIGDEDALWHRLEAPEAGMPGQWLLRISQGGRVLLEKLFTVTPE